MNQEHNIVSVSGGKDSTALLLLAIERQPDNMQAVFCDTGHEHQQTYEYLYYLADATGIHIRWVKADFSAEFARKRERLEKIASGEMNDPYGKHRWSAESAKDALKVFVQTGNPFLDMCMLKGMFPSTKSRFCSELLKRDVIHNQVNKPIWDAGNEVVSWQGVRADESLARSKLQEEEDVNQQYRIIRPILNWSAEDCFAMHKKHGIKHNPLYEQGMKRVGCMPCIHSVKDELLEIGKRFPEEIARVADWERIVASQSKSGGRSFFHESSGRGSGIYAAVEWAKTGIGGRQLDFLRVQNDGPICSSIYGLCE